MSEAIAYDVSPQNSRLLVQRIPIDEDLPAWVQQLFIAVDGTEWRVVAGGCCWAKAQQAASAIFDQHMLALAEAN